MSKPAAGSRLRIGYGSLCTVLIALSAAAAGVFFLQYSTEARNATLVQALSAFPIDGQRFFLGPSSSADEDASSVSRRKEVLREAYLFISSAPSPKTTRLRALIAAAEGYLIDASKTLLSLEGGLADAEVLNDLGVIYWGLGKDNPSNFFRALDYFEQSARLAPDALAPRHNLARGYKKLHLKEPAENASHELEAARRRGTFYPTDRETVPEDLIKTLRTSLQDTDRSRAEYLLKHHAPLFREMAIKAALNPKTMDDAAKFALDYYANTPDSTIRAVREPLRSSSSDRIIAARKHVQDGITAYFKSNFEESLRSYDLAEDAIRNENSPFDELWIKLKRADTLLRTPRTDPALRRMDVETSAKLLDEVLHNSRKLGFDLLFGQALASKAAAVMTSQNQDQIVPMLNESVRTLEGTGMLEETARPLNYLSTIYGLAGDTEISLSKTYDGLSVTPEDDHVRLAQLYWMAGQQVYRVGFRKYALILATQALEEAIASPNRGLVPAVIPSLATIQASEGDTASAERYLRMAEAERTRIVGPQRDFLDLAINLLCAQVRTGSRDLPGADKCLRANLPILKSLPISAPDFHSQTLMLLAQVSDLRGRKEEARRFLKEATNAIEQNDEYFATAALRMPFENLRRNLYDIAIAFEYDDHKQDAWVYLQQYRSKLFLEFLKQMNPGVVRILDKAVDRSQVQQLIPDDLQTIEYVQLKDRLLIWLVSSDKFEPVAVDIDRGELEKKVSNFVERIAAQEDVQRTSEELYDLLIEPIAELLDPNRKIAIIPDQALHRLNFAALYSRQAKSYFLEQFEFGESPNMTTLLSGDQTSPPRVNAISFGSLQDTTNASSELQQLQKIYPVMQTFNRERAVKPSFLSAMNTASVFHFAGHSQDAANPLTSSILLDGDREGPNSVTALDIARHPMPRNSVVVLASCDSSVGNSRDGIGMRGLTSAFLISGAGSVVGSLWRVESDSTSQLVVQFHKNFATEHHSVAASLREAQLKFIREGRHKHPYFWSGFVVTGNTSVFR